MGCSCCLLSILYTFFVLMLFTLIVLRKPAVLYYAKLTLYYSLLTIMAIVLIPVWAVRPQHADNYQYAQKAIKMISKLFGMKYKIIGLENMITNDKPCVVICNHQSSIDLLGIPYIYPPRCVGMAKKALSYAGPFGIGMWLCGTIFVNRGSGTAQEITTESAKIMNDRQVKVLMFPEGTRNKNSELLPFKKGAFYLAVAAKVPIVPVVLSAYAPFYSSIEKRFEKGNVTISVLPPIKTDDLTDADVPALTERTRDIMVDVYQRTSEQAI